MRALAEKLRGALDVTKCDLTNTGEINVQFALRNAKTFLPLEEPAFDVYLDASSEAVVHATIADLQKKYNMETAAHMATPNKKALERRTRKIAECTAVQRVVEAVYDWLGA